MPDDNKFAALREAGYTIPGLCGTCEYGEFSGNSPWGSCGLVTYDHLKHDNPEGGRGVSIRRDGRCSLYSSHGLKVESQGYGAHMEFFDDGSGATDSA